MGDEIQSLAAEQYLPRLDGRVDRDALSSVFGPHKVVVIMNGWFTKFAHHWPPSSNVLPVYFGFHISPHPAIISRRLSPDSIEHFLRFSPIGCRDRATLDLLAGAGVKGFLSKCLTLTFPTRSISESQRKVFLVDVPEFLRRIVPEELIRDAVTVSHDVQDIYGETIKFDIARHLLSLYREQARLVITTRLHCTLPCLAMGIPVIFFADIREARVTVAQEVGLITYPLDARREDVDWNPAIHDIAAEKESIVAALRQKWTAATSTL
jgi:hypothetical protein